jgi:hypothetical protein
MDCEDLQWVVNPAICLMQTLGWRTANSTLESTLALKVLALHAEFVTVLTLDAEPVQQFFTSADHPWGSYHGSWIL